MTRKMAYIVRIDDIQPIDGADAIECAHVGGWRVVIKKGEFSVGDLVVYCEIDSWIPTEIAPFLSKGQDPREYNGVKGERLRTVKLRGQISQGLILPISDDTKAGLGSQLSEGIDLTDHLFIQKYEHPVPACLSGVSRGNFPSQVPKTDEERVQNFKSKDWVVLNKYDYECTEKLEGSSATYAMINGEFHVCSRNLDLKETDDNTFWKIAHQYDIEQKLRNLGLDNIAIQGEIVGEGVQSNHYKLKGHRLYVFTVYDIVKGEYLRSRDRQKVVNDLQLLHVPVIEPCKNISGWSVEQVLAYADGQSAINPDVLREGVVFKRFDGQEHWKAVSNKYLIKTGT